MLLTTALSFATLVAVASTLPLEPRDVQEYKDITQVLDRIAATVHTLGNSVSAWPGNPKRTNTFNQITNYVPTIKQGCANLLSDLQVGTDWVQRTTKGNSLGVTDAVSLAPRLAALNSAVSAYKDALLEKRSWADTSSVTPQLYDQLRLQKQGATSLANAITHSLGVTTSWLGGPVSDFFFGSKLDEAIQAYSEGGKYRSPGFSSGGPVSYNPSAPPFGAQPAPYPSQGPPYPGAFGQPPYPQSSSWRVKAQDNADSSSQE